MWLVVERDLSQSRDVARKWSNVLLGSVEEACSVWRRGVEVGVPLVGVVGMLGPVGGYLVVVETRTVVIQRRGVPDGCCSCSELGDCLNIVFCFDSGAVGGGREGERGGVGECG